MNFIVPFHFPHTEILFRNAHDSIPLDILLIGKTYRNWTKIIWGEIFSSCIHCRETYYIRTKTVQSYSADFPLWRFITQSKKSRFYTISVILHHEKRKHTLLLRMNFKFCVIFRFYVFWIRGKYSASNSIQKKYFCWWKQIVFSIWFFFKVNWEMRF